MMGLWDDLQSQNIPSSVIDINNVRGSVLGTGQAFSNLLDNDLTWEVPKGSGKSPLFQYSLWVGATDENNQIHLAAHRYNQDGRDYWMGPVQLMGASDWVEQEFERIWKINRSQIEEFVSHHGQPGYEIPQDILTWPAEGNVLPGASVYLSHKAPFVDVNNDGLYNPEDGDYPDFPGDQCLFFIFNDYHANHTETDGRKIGLEVHAMVYAYDIPDNVYLNNTVFFHYDLFNRTTYRYKGAYVGVWNDWDIGNGGDDYVGCNVRLGTCYGYNASDYDEVYGDNPPVQLCTILGGPYMDPDELDNKVYQQFYFTTDSTYICNESQNGLNFDNGVIDDERYGLTRFVMQSNGNESMDDPITAEETYRTLRGLWKDGNHVQYGGNGYPAMTGVVGPSCRFMFPADSDPCNFGTNGVLPNGGYNIDDHYWTEYESGNVPGDRRGLAVTGPFTFEPYTSQPLDFALTTVWNSETHDALDRIEEAVENVKQKFISADFHAVTETPMSQENLLKVYPNPSKGFVTIEGIGRLRIVNTLGQKVLESDIEGQTTITLPAGLYFVLLGTEKHCSMEKLVVQ